MATSTISFPGETPSTELRHISRTVATLNPLLHGVQRLTLNYVAASGFVLAKCQPT
jgi:hypothetical protein